VTNAGHEGTAAVMQGRNSKSKEQQQQQQMEFAGVRNSTHL
jgi:hypothetical protein